MSDIRHISTKLRQIVKNDGTVILERLCRECENLVSQYYRNIEAKKQKAIDEKVKEEKQREKERIEEEERHERQRKEEERRQREEKKRKEERQKEEEKRRKLEEEEEEERKRKEMQARMVSRSFHRYLTHDVAS